MFSYEICKIFKNAFFNKATPVAASSNHLSFFLKNVQIVCTQSVNGQEKLFISRTKAISNNFHQIIDHSYIQNYYDSLY